MSNEASEQPKLPEGDDAESKSRRRILIGSQKGLPGIPSQATPRLGAGCCVSGRVQTVQSGVRREDDAAPPETTMPPPEPGEPQTAVPATASAVEAAPPAEESAVHPAAQLLLDEADEADALSAAAAAGLADSSRVSATGFPPTNFRGRLRPIWSRKWKRPWKACRWTI